MVSRSGILRNITWLSSSSLLVRPLWFVFITAFCMRVLGAEGYGVMAAALSLMTIAAFFSDLGTEQLTVREVARRTDGASLYFTNLLAARSLISAIAVAGGLAVGLLLGYRSDALFALAMAGLYAMGLRLLIFCRSLFRAFEVLRYEAVSVVFEKGTVVALGIAGLVATRTAGGALSGMAVGMAIVLVITIYWIHRHLSPLRPTLLGREFVRKTFRIALPLGLYGIFSAVQLNSGVVLLDAMRDEATAGRFGAAYRILEALMLMPEVMVAAILPRLSSLFHSGDRSDFRRIFGRSVLGVTALSVIAAAVIAAFGVEIINLLDPSRDFDEAGRLLKFLVWAYPLIAVNYLLTIALVASDQQRILAVFLGIGAAVTIVLNVVLIPGFGYYGSAAALMVSVGVVLIACAWRLRRSVNGGVRAEKDREG